MNISEKGPIAGQNPKDYFIGAGYALTVAAAFGIARVAAVELDFPKAANILRIMVFLPMFAAGLWAAWGCFVFAWQCATLLLRGAAVLLERWLD